MNKTALVTGSTSGIGLAIVRAMAKRGVNVIITGFGDENLISGIVDEIRGLGVRADFVAADLSSVTDIDRLWSETTRLCADGIDILVNNAGLTHINAIENTTEETWNKLIAVMLSAPFHLIKRCLPIMKAKGWGRIVNTSSVDGLVGVVNAAPHVAAKHGLVGLTKSVALESAAHGITCNAVCPGCVLTPLFKEAAELAADLIGVSSEELEMSSLSECPTGQVIQPAQVAELVEFLCMSTASSQMTGATYLIDGGLTAK